MTETSGHEIIQRLWSEHKFAVLARSRDVAQEIAREMASGPPAPGVIMEALGHVMTQRETNLAEAVQEAWTHLTPRVGSSARDAVQTMLEQNTEEARWLLAGLAEDAADAVVASSRLFDHPAAVNRIWLRDRRGPTMYMMENGEPMRVSPAEVGQVLTRAFGPVAPRVLRLCLDRPRLPSEVEAEVGEDGPKVLEAANQLLVLRRIAGFYRSRGAAAQLVLIGLGRL